MHGRVDANHWRVLSIRSARCCISIRVDLCYRLRALALAGSAHVAFVLSRVPDVYGDLKVAAIRCSRIHAQPSRESALLRCDGSQYERLCLLRHVRFRRCCTVCSRRCVTVIKHESWSRRRVIARTRSAQLAVFLVLSVPQKCCCCVVSSVLSLTSLR